MNGKSYDKLIADMKNLILNDELDTKFLCKEVQKHYLDLSESDKSAYADKIKRLKERTDEKQYDDETRGIGLDILESMLYNFTNQLDGTLSSYLTTNEINIQQFYRNASNLQNIHSLLQILIILGAASLPVILNNSDIPKSVPTVISIIVAVAAGLTTYFGLKTHFSYYQRFADELITEQKLYVSGRKYYSDLPKGEALDLFMDKIDVIWYENRKISDEIEKSSQDHDRKINELVKGK